MCALKFSIEKKHVIALLAKELNICQHNERKGIAIASVQKNLTERTQTQAERARQRLKLTCALCNAHKKRTLEMKKVSEQFSRYFQVDFVRIMFMICKF